MKSQNITTFGFCLSEEKPFNTVRYYAGLSERTPELDKWMLFDIHGTYVSTVSLLPELNDEESFEVIRWTAERIHAERVIDGQV